MGTGNMMVGDVPGRTRARGSRTSASGNFHLINDGITTFADIAQWQTGDPPWDIDHEDRPMTDGASDYAGADVP